MKKKVTPTTPKKAVRRGPRRGDWHPAFLEAMRTSGNVLYSAQKAAVDRGKAYKHRKTSVAFAKAWDEAMNDAIDSLEVAAWQRARNGVVRERGVYHNGQLIGTETVTEYSDTLLIFLLKAYRPEKYRESVRQEPGPGDRRLPSSNVLIMLPTNGRDKPEAPVIDVGTKGGNGKGAAPPQLPENTAEENSRNGDGGH